MKVIQIVKQLNNTELGKGGTHDTYVLIPNDLDITDIFEPNVEIEFTDMMSNEKVKVRNTVGREKRIAGLGQYYRNRDLYAGDEIVFEKRIQADIVKHYVYTQRHTDNLVIQKSQYGFEILVPERLQRFQASIALMNADVKIEHRTSRRKRNDSPEETDFYNIQIAGKNLEDTYRGKEAVEIQIRDNGISVSGFYGWKKYAYVTED